MSIHKKLLLTFITFSAVLIVSMALLMKWSFQRGFNKYILEQDIQTLQEITPELAQYYERHNGWGRLQNDPRAFIRLLRRFNRLREATSSDEPDPPGSRPFHLPVFLLSPDGQLIAGRAPEDKIFHLEPVYIDDQLIAQLGLTERQRPFNRHDERFAQQQAQRILEITLLALALSLLFAWPVSKFLLRRIQSLAQQVRALTQGQYQQHITVQGRDELAELATRLNDLADTLANTESSRRKFVADISHELRTPLATLRAQLEAIEDGIHQYNPETHHTLHGQVMRLHKLVDDLYQLSLTDLGALQYQKIHCDPEEQVMTAVESFLPAFDQAGIELKLDNRLKGNEQLYADPQRIQQLLGNLLQNSIQYTDSPGTTAIRCSSHNKWLKLEIEDSTPGVTDQQLPHLFDRLYRTESSRNRDHGGAGLGLNLCHNIVTAHQGEVDLQHSPLGGIKVTIKLPLN